MTNKNNLTYKWWRSYRPHGWTELAHIEHPTVGLTTKNSKYEFAAARTIASIVRSFYRRDGKKRTFVDNVSRAVKREFGIL